MDVTNKQLFNGTLYGTYYLTGKNITNLIKSVKSYYFPDVFYNINTLYINESVLDCNRNQFLEIIHKLNDLKVQNILFHSHPYPDINELIMKDNHSMQ